jgi:nucleoid DNA-binding protein
MVKQDLVAAVAQQVYKDPALPVEVRAKLGREVALAHVEAFMACVERAMLADEPVHLRGFGSFQVVMRKGKTVRTGPGLTGTATIPARKVVVFKPSDKMTERLRGDNASRRGTVVNAAADGADDADSSLATARGGRTEGRLETMEGRESVGR